MFSFQIHSASKRFSSSGAVRMRGQLDPIINHEGASTVGNLGRASRYSKRVGIRNCRREMIGYVSASGAVGRINGAYLVCDLKPDRIVIRNSARELASVLLLRQAQPPLASQDEGSRLVLFRKFLPLVHLRQKPASGIPVSLSAALSCVVSHGSNHRTGVRQGAEKPSHELVIQRQGPRHA